MRFLLLLTLLIPSFAQAYNCKITSQADAAVITTSALIIAKQNNRKCLILENKDAAINVYVKFGSAHSGTEGLLLRANTRWEAMIPPHEDVYLKSASGVPTVGFMAGE